MPPMCASALGCYSYFAELGLSEVATFNAQGDAFDRDVVALRARAVSKAARAHGRWVHCTPLGAWPGSPAFPRLAIPWALRGQGDTSFVPGVSCCCTESALAR